MSQNMNQPKSRVRMDVIGPLAVIAAICFGLIILDTFVPNLLSLNLPTELKTIFMLVGVLCLIGISFLAFPTKKKGPPASKQQKPMFTPQRQPTTTTTQVDSGDDGGEEAAESRGKGRPRKPCALATQGLVACPLAEVTPEFPPLLMEKLAQQVTRQVAMNMLSVFDPERYNALMEARKAKEEELRQKREAANNQANHKTPASSTPSPEKVKGDDFLTSLIELAGEGEGKDGEKKQ